MSPSKRAPKTLSGGEWLRIGAMGFVLALVVFMLFFTQSAAMKEGPPAVETSPEVDATPVPQLDPAILAEIADSTRTDRLLVPKEEPLQHLLEKSLAVTPSVAKKLGMPPAPVPIDEVRNAPDHFRGRYLWYKGKLEALSGPKPGHPVPGYDWYEGRLRTSDGEPVLFAFSVPPDPSLTIGSWVRMEGFFLKLRDAHLPVPLDRAPMLVGPKLFKAYPDWQAVTELDPAVLARVDDGTWKENPGPPQEGVANGDFVDAPDVGKMLDESQDVPLWHLASYAMHKVDDPALQWNKLPPFVTKEQLDAVRSGEMKKGTPVRLVGVFQYARVMPASPNPLGIDSWTEAWIQVGGGLGGKMIPLWIPKALDSHWRKKETVVATGFLFKRYRYETQNGATKWTPLFVVAQLHPFQLSGNELSNPITYAFAGLVLLVVIVFFVMARRDRRQRQRHEATLLERRRKRRALTSSLAENS